MICTYTLFYKYEHSDFVAAVPLVMNSLSTQIAAQDQNTAQRMNERLTGHQTLLPANHNQLIAQTMA